MALATVSPLNSTRIVLLPGIRSPVMMPLVAIQGNPEVNTKLRPIQMKISVVCCDSSPEKLSRIVEIELAPAELERRVLETAEQQLAPGEARDLHNAAHHVEHGPVTYVQQVTAGGFSVSVGKPDDLEETYFGKDSFVAFMDDEGPGHGSKVGPEGVTRTFRILKGHLSV